MSKGFIKSIAGLFGLTDPGFYRIMSPINNDAASGKNVTADTALSLSAVWACVSLISQTIATLPIDVYSEDQKGNRTKIPDHPLSNLLDDQPNADMTSVEFWEAIIGNMLMWGNGYGRKTYNGVGDVIDLTLMSPDRMTVRRMPDGSIRYYFAPWNGGQTEEYTEDELFHVKGWSMNGLVGLSPISYARSSLGTAMAADEASGKFFANGLNLSGFVETGGPVLTDAQRKQFHASLDSMRGSGNTGKTMLLEGAFKYNPLSLSPADAQMLATRQYSVDEICRWFRVPGHMIGHEGGGRSSNAVNLEQRMIEFSTFTLRPWLKRIEKRIKMQLIKPSDQGKVHVEFNLAGLLRGDSAARAALYSAMVQNGIQSRAEIRPLENLPYDPDSEGLTVQSNLVFMSDLGKDTPDQTTAGFGLPPKPRAPDPTSPQPTEKQ